MSAFETLCFMRCFSFIIGHLIPSNNECWQLYKFLRQILDIVTSSRIIRSDAKTLKLLIEQHNRLYIKLFGDLKPKFNILCHYPQIILLNGPCVNFWNMRFESRHRSLEANVHATNCSKNLLLTIARKETLKMAEIFHTTRSENTIDYISPDSTDETYSATAELSHEAKYYKEAEINSTRYKIGTFIVSNMEESEIEFGEIVKIIKINDDAYFQINVFDEIIFDDHFHSYHVKKRVNEVRIVKYADLLIIAPCISIKKRKTHFVSPKYVL